MEARRARLANGRSYPWTRRGMGGLVGLLTLTGTLALAGCAASDVPTPGDATSSASAQTTPEDAEADGLATTDTDTCAAIGDVMTIGFNAELAAREGRMTSQEEQGWYRLATRVLHLVPTRGEGPVSEAVTELQAAIPQSAPGAMGTSLMESDEWQSALPGLLEACAAAGSEIATSSFTGG